jgi:hypothetical protein
MFSMVAGAGAEVVVVVVVVVAEQHPLPTAVEQS